MRTPAGKERGKERRRSSKPLSYIKESSFVVKIECIYAFSTENSILQRVFYINSAINLVYCRIYIIFAPEMK